MASGCVCEAVALGVTRLNTAPVKSEPIQREADVAKLVGLRHAGLLLSPSRSVDLGRRRRDLDRGVADLCDELGEPLDHVAKRVLQIAGAGDVDPQITRGHLLRGVGQLLEHVEHVVELAHELANLVGAQHRDAAELAQISDRDHAAQRDVQALERPRDRPHRAQHRDQREPRQ
jgi:hypothetical protein